MASAGSDGGDDCTPQMAPMIDVILVLIACFLATASTVSQEFQLGVKVPGPGKNQNIGPVTTIELSISEKGAVEFNTTLMDSPDSKDLPKLVKTLSNLVSKFADQPVVIKPHANTAHERVVDVLNACSAAGVSCISFGGG